MFAVFSICVSKVQRIVCRGRAGFLSVLLKALWQREHCRSGPRVTSCDSSFFFFISFHLFIFFGEGGGYHWKWCEEDKCIWMMYAVSFHEFVWSDTKYELSIVCWDERIMNLGKFFVCRIVGGGDKIVVVFHLGEFIVFAWNFWFLFTNVK